MYVYVSVRVCACARVCMCVCAIGRDSLFKDDCVVRKAPVINY